jgi:hypothetical protein
MKAEIQKMVAGALTPHYERKQVDKATFTDINRDISRMLYDRVWDAGGLVDSLARERWGKVAVKEVERAVRQAKMKHDKKKEDKRAAEEAAVTTTPSHDLPVRSSATVSA